MLVQLFQLKKIIPRSKKYSTKKSFKYIKVGSYLEDFIKKNITVLFGYTVWKI
jgi:hypothetical protein